MPTWLLAMVQRYADEVIPVRKSSHFGKFGNGRVPQKETVRSAALQTSACITCSNSCSLAVPPETVTMSIVDTVKGSFASNRSKIGKIGNVHFHQSVQSLVFCRDLQRHYAVHQHYPAHKLLE
jgi:hypothetical protein